MGRWTLKERGYHLKILFKDIIFIIDGDIFIMNK